MNADARRDLTQNIIQGYRDGWFGTPAFNEDGVVHECKLEELREFLRRYGMGPKLFSRLHHEIQKPRRCKLI